MSGQNGQLGFKTESTWGTAVVVDLFHPGYLSGNPTRDQPPLISKGQRAGRRTPKCISTGPKTVEGSVSTELYTAPLATLLRHMFGTIATTGSGPYTHTASPGTLNSKSLTMQFGIGDVGSITRALTYSGCKFEKWSLKAESGEIAMLDLDITAKDYVTATALATASYPTDCPFTYVHGSVSIAGTPITTVKSFELTSERPLRKFHPVGSLTVVEQIEEGRSDQPFGITVETEFESLTVHDLANTAVAVVLAFSDGTNSLTVTTNAWVVPTTPEVQGVDSLNSFTFEAIPYGTTDAAAVTAVLVNGESTSA